MSLDTFVVDAIAVLGNICRHREEFDPDPISAVLDGTRRVVFSVMAAALTLVAIFAKGIIGCFFGSFASRPNRPITGPDRAHLRGSPRQRRSNPGFRPGFETEGRVVRGALILP